MKHVKLFEQFVAEEATTSWSKMMKGVRAGDSGPWSLVGIENKKVTAQRIDIRTKEALPAEFEAMRREHPKAKIHIEDGGGMVVWNETLKIQEAYKDIPYNMKIAGVYEVDINHPIVDAAVVRIAGFERQGDDTDALYFMDNDPYKSEFGNLIVKNKDMFTLSKGKSVSAYSTKTNEKFKIKRLRDL